ncbi:MAG: sugar ABC transporter permease [Treponema sp.]|jgi:multiple sugar transport system permease protein|nr:sugar ABC transporter permease [Treponema sp.]
MYRLKRQTKENIAGYIFILPYLIGFIIFQGLPFVIAFVLGFTNIKFISRLEGVGFTGLANFIRMFGDPETMAALLRSGIYTVLYVPLILVSGFIFALLINQKIRLTNLIKTLLFLPYVSNMIAVSVIFKLLLSPDGPIIGFFASLGIDVFPPLYDLNFALPTVVVIAVWSGMGLYMITFLAALQGVPSELLEAAKIDGAGSVRRVFSVIIPVITPTAFFLVISAIITSLQNFTIIQTFTAGGPGRATTVLSIQIVRTAFTAYQTGYASAQAIILFIIVLFITLIQWKGQKQWVTY